MIEKNKDNRNWEIESIDEYQFQGKTVYTSNPDNSIIADGATTIVLTDCSNPCYIGGFAGNANIKCNGEVFYDKAILKRSIWKK